MGMKTLQNPENTKPALHIQTEKAENLTPNPRPFPFIHLKY